MRKPELLLAAAFSDEERAALAQSYVVHDLGRLTEAGQGLGDVADRIQAIATTGAVGARSDLMAKLPRLEIVSVFGVGLDAVDLDHAKDRGVRVTYTPDVLTDDVADMGMALLLAVLRQITRGDRWVRDGRWPKGPMPLTTSLRGKTLGILGLGRIGRAVATRAEAFGMTILYMSRSQRTVPYGYRSAVLDLAKDSDVLMITAAGGAETKGLVDAAVLSALGAKGVVINIARGSLIDEPALIEALAAGRIAGAGLDVFPDEPHVNPGLLTLDSVVLQPHNGSGTHETRRAIGALMRANLAAHFAGEPLPTPVF
jgi:D-3-phosphoglycerate dehydrogenase